MSAKPDNRRYLILSASNVDFLEAGVNTKLDEGYVLAGPILPAYGAVHQPMIKVEATADMQAIALASRVRDQADEDGDVFLRRLHRLLLDLREWANRMGSWEAACWVDVDDTIHQMELFNIEPMEKETRQ